MSKHVVLVAFAAAAVQANAQYEELTDEQVDQLAVEKTLSEMANATSSRRGRAFYRLRRRSTGRSTWR